MQCMNEESKRWFGASTLSLLLIVSILTVTYAYVEPDSWSSPSIWVQDTNTSTGILWCDDASGASGQQERELLYIGVDFDEDYLYVRWDVEQVPENIEQTYYVLVIALGSSTVTDVATHSLQFDVDRYDNQLIHNLEGVSENINANLICIAFIIIYMKAKPVNIASFNLVLILLIIGSMFNLYAYMADYAAYLFKNYSLQEVLNALNNEGLLQYAQKYIPIHFNWWMFLSGVLIHFIAIYFLIIKNSIHRVVNNL